MWQWLSGLFAPRAEEPARYQPPASTANPNKATDRLALLLQRHRIELHQIHREPLLKHIREGRKIEAIKLLRTKGKPGLGLKEAKDFVDAF
ncbi:MAG: ribosomal protein L7/L12 [Bryobacterales bacterium]|jgi:ribosomal protein L7/L12|nr:ribosomal protein L7/L12 [Bryobacterales bacterium]